MDEYKKLLKEFIAFKSISTDPQYKSEIQSCVNWLKNLLVENKFSVDVIKGFANPIILAEHDNNKEETVLVYGHYDVQPADIDDGWFEDPFKLFEKNNKLYARGAIDNKGQVLIHLVNIFRLIKEDQLKYNIKLIIEGSEEVGSPQIDDFIKDNKEKLKSDFILISDSAMLANKPTIEAGMRGVINLSAKISTSDRELHSGLFGGVLPNASHLMSKIISNLWDENNKVLVPDFYEAVDEIDDEIKSRVIKNEESIIKLTGYKKITKPFENIEFFAHTGLIPSIEMTGLRSGYIQEGFKNSVPYEAEAKLNIRLVESQDPEIILESTMNYIKKLTPTYADVEFYIDAMLPAVKINIDNKYINQVKQLLEKSFDSKINIDYSGGSLPLVKYIKDNLKAPIVLVGLANEDSNMHGANENFDLDILNKSLRFSYEFFKNKN